MNCPNCNSKEHIDIDLHADGFSQSLYECGDCGSIWTYSGSEPKVIKQPARKKVTAYSDFTCPTCSSILCVRTDLNAFQFHEELHTCSNCGTVCSFVHDQVEVVIDSQRGSFLSVTSEMVEADDYVFV